jgi:hypothetical protein
MATLSPRARRWAGIASAAVIAWAVLHGMAPEAQSGAAPVPVSESPPTSRTAVSGAAPARRARLQLDLIEQARPAPEDADSERFKERVRLFAAHSWQPPPPKPPPPRAPEPPRAPPFPYAYIGSLDDEQGRLAFFLEGGSVMAVRQGQMLGAYRVDALGPEGANVTYLPLAQSINVPLGARNGP